MRTITVDVTAKDIVITAAHAGFGIVCPVDVSLGRVIRGEYRIVASYSRIFIQNTLRDEPLLVSVKTPPAVASFMSAFDRGDPVTPIRFQLELPESVLCEVNGK